MNVIIIYIYINDENLGYKENFKKAISLCSGEYIFLADQDDVWECHKIETLMKLMIENEQIKVLSSSFSLIDEKSQQIDCKDKIGYSNHNLYKRIIGKNKLVQVKTSDLVFRNISQGCAMVITKDIAKLFINNFDETLPHDWQINILGSLYGNNYFYNKELFRYRQHTSNTIGINISGKNNLNYKRFCDETRLGSIECCFLTTDYINKVDSTYIKNNYDIAKILEFSIKHKEYIKNKKLIRLIIQVFNPSYIKAKSVKNIIVDIVYLSIYKFL